MFKEVDALAVGAHPDDVEIGCAGTLFKLKSLGLRIGIVDLTQGELGTRGSVEVRRQEAEEAGKLLGAEFRVNLELEDGNVLPDKENRLKLIQVIRACRPRLVITHSAGGHPDHGNAKVLVEEAVHHAGLARIETGQERHRPHKVAFWLVSSHAVVPQVIGDVSDFMKEKERVVRAHKSQLYDPNSQLPETYLSQPDFIERIVSFNRHLGSMVRCHYGEGFLLSRLPKLENLVEV